MGVSLKRLLDEGGMFKIFLNWEGGENENKKEKKYIYSGGERAGLSSLYRALAEFSYNMCTCVENDFLKIATRKTNIS